MILTRSSFSFSGAGCLAPRYTFHLDSSPVDSEGQRSAVILLHYNMADTLLWSVYKPTKYSLGTKLELGRVNCCLVMTEALYCIGRRYPCKFREVCSFLEWEKPLGEQKAAHIQGKTFKTQPQLISFPMV